MFVPKVIPLLLHEPIHMVRHFTNFVDCSYTLESGITNLSPHPIPDSRQRNFSQTCLLLFWKRQCLSSYIISYRLLSFPASHRAIECCGEFVISRIGGNNRLCLQTQSRQLIWGTSASSIDKFRNDVYLDSIKTVSTSSPLIPDFSRFFWHTEPCSEG